MEVLAALEVADKGGTRQECLDALVALDVNPNLVEAIATARTPERRRIYLQRVFDLHNVDPPVTWLLVSLRIHYGIPL